jgi:hypothetical protein
MTEWMLRRGRRPPVGPVTTQRLIRAIKVGRVPPDTEACKVGSDDWRLYSKYPELELALDSSDVTERPSEGPPLRLESERAGPNTARSAEIGSLAPRLSSPWASDEDEDDDEAVTQVVSTPFAAPEPKPEPKPEPRPTPRPAAGVPPPKPAGWSSRPGPPSQPTVRATPSSTTHARPGATAQAGPPRPAAAAPRPAAGVAAPPRPTPSRLSSPIAVPPPVPSSPRAALSRPSTPGPLPPPPTSNPFAAPLPPQVTNPAPIAPNSVPPSDDDDVDDEARTHVVASPAELPTNRPPGLKPRDSAPEAARGAQIGGEQAVQSPVVSPGAFPPPAVETPLPVAPVVIAPPEPTKVRTPPPPAPIPSYPPPPPVLDATTKALIALIIALSIGLTIVLFLLWRRS